MICAKLFYYEKLVVILNDITHSILWFLLEAKGVHKSYFPPVLKISDEITKSWTLLL